MFRRSDFHDIYKTQTKKMLICVLLLTVITCQGFELNMERKPFVLKDQDHKFCGRLSCQVDTVSEELMSHLLKMIIYYTPDRVHLATISTETNVIGDLKSSTTKVVGSISKSIGIVQMYFSENHYCIEDTFICQVFFKNEYEQIVQVEKVIEPQDSKIDSSDSSAKSYLMFGQHVVDKNGSVPKRLSSKNSDFNDLNISFQIGNFQAPNTEETSKFASNQDIEMTKNLEKRLSAFENRIVALLNRNLEEIIFQVDNNFNKTKEIYEILREYNESSIKRDINQQIDQEDRDTNKSFVLQDSMKFENIRKESSLTHAMANISLYNERLDQILSNLSRFTQVQQNINILNCSDIQPKCERGMTKTLGQRVVTSLDNHKPVLCDTETDGGGWIIIQRRIKGDTNFNRNWQSYKEGFGSLTGDFWLGNDNISDLTRKDKYQLRIDMRNGSNTYYVNYNSFILEYESMNYTLRVGNFTGGNIQDSLSYHNNMPFSTQDREYKHKCASSWKSAWWYDNCYNSNLNGVWDSYDLTGITWYDNSVYRTMNYVEVKIRVV